MTNLKIAALIVAMFVVASFDGVRAGEYDDRAAKAAKSIERTQAKLAKLQACAANPQPCAAEEAAKAQKALDRATAKAAKANALLSNVSLSQ